MLYTPLLQIDEDVQRHNELIEMIKEKPSEISEIVSGCRKDFTNEFFVHLHTVAESYNDNPKVQNGETNFLLDPHSLFLIVIYLAFKYLVAHRMISP